MPPTHAVAALMGLAAAISAQAAPSSPLDGITREQALTLPPPELADRVFRAAGARMQTVTRPLAGDSGEEGPPDELVFATAPRSAGDPGQCVATAVHVGRERAPDSFLSEPGVIATELVYKVVGDVEPGADLDEAAMDRQEQLCARTGPVIPATEADEGKPVFFRFAGARIPTMPLIALQRAIRGARDGSYVNVTCAEEPGAEAAACPDPKALLGTLDLASLSEVEMSRPGTRDTLYRIDASFVDSARAFWQLTLDVDFSVTPQAGRIVRLGRAAIHRGTVFDVDDGSGPASE